MKNKSYLLRIAETLFAVLIGLTAAKAHAATINVDTTAQCDTSFCPPDDGQPGCSFGEAIAVINGGSDGVACTNSSSDPYGANDTINLPSGQTLGYSFSDHGNPVGPTALPAITRSVTIHGNGATLVRKAFSVDTERVEDMRFFEISSLFDTFIDNIDNSFFNLEAGSEVMVFWDETTFDGGNPGCGFVGNIFKRVTLDFVPTASFAVSNNIPCYSGGAGYVRGNGTFVSFDHTTFKDNQVELHRPFKSPLGGAVFLDGGAFGQANFSHSLFTGNKAPAGGAIYAGVNVQMAISDSTFAKNAAQVLNDQDQPDTQPTADNEMGGAVYAEGLALTVNDSTFFQNQAGIAGAIAVRGKAASILNTTFFDNVADLSGGAVAVIPVPYNYRDLYGPTIANTYLGSDGFNQFFTDAFSRFGTSPSANLQHVTAVGNSVGEAETMPAVSSGGGIANLGAGVVSLKSLILTGNAVATGGSGPNCYGAFLSYGTNDLNWPNSDGSCVAVMAPGANPDMSLDPVLKACNPDVTTAGLASCDPDTTSPLLEAALVCPADDQHHAPRRPEKCTVGAIEVTPPPPPPTETSGTVCGNGQVEEGEQCDEGESRNSDQPDATCRTDCTTQRCGDGIVDSASGEQCEPSLDPINCRSDCTIDLCFQVKGDAIRVGAGDLKLSEYLAKYGISPTTGCSANPAVNQCQPLSSLGGPGSDHADFTVPNTVCQTTAGGNGCSLIRESDSGTNAGPWVLLALPVVLLTWPFSRRLGLFSRT